MEQNDGAEAQAVIGTGDVNGIPHVSGPPKAEQKQATTHDEKPREEDSEGVVFKVIVKLPHEPFEHSVMVSTQEQVQDLRQSIVEHPDTYQYSCFHLEHRGTRINDFIELSEVNGLLSEREVKLVEDPYSEKEARMHVTRIRDLIGAAGDRVDTLHGILAGMSLHDAITPPDTVDSQNGKPQSLLDAPHALVNYDFEAPASLQNILPRFTEPPPRIVKSISVSAWNPPPHYLRQRGHHMYLQLITNEGEQFQITSHVSGFYVNKSSNSKFDPYPRPDSKGASAHSLLSLVRKVSPSFANSFLALQKYNNGKDPLANFQITNTIPASPWIVPASESSPAIHQADITRTQEAYLLAGIENAETLRDWNEEFQSTRELPKQTVQDRVFRERLTMKLFADYNDAAARGAVMVARGEIAPLNPTENRDAQIYVYNNIFFSYGADGVGTFTSEGGNEAARVAVGKDVSGVRVANQLDIDGLYTPGTVVVDYLGKRLVAQSIVPGIFKQRELGEHQIDYGGVEGREVVADNEAFIPVFSKLSSALKVKKHDVWDKEGKTHALEGSVETKGLLGTDGRKYVLDLYRLTPLDITWIEQHWGEGSDSDSKPLETNYPHRMAILRPELINAYWRYKMTDFVRQELEKRKTLVNNAASDVGGSSGREDLQKNGNAESSEIFDETAVPNLNETNTTGQPNNVDISSFDLAFNPDVFCGQTPPSDEEKAKLAKDEEDVRSVCSYLHENAIPELISDLREGDVGFPMDGQSLGRLMHKRGINIRYLGKLADLAKEQSARLDALNALAIQEMIARSFKHVVNRYLKNLPAVFAPQCLSQLLNCLLGTDICMFPKVELEEDVRAMYDEGDFSFENLTVESLRTQIQSQVYTRYRYALGDTWHSKLKHIQLLREVSLKLGLQLAAKDYQFSVSSTPPTNGAPNANTNGVTNGIHPASNGASNKKKKRNGDHDQKSQSSESVLLIQPLTFCPDDLLNIVPIVRDACPRSLLAEEALEAGRISIIQNQRELGQDLLLESLSLHEQIYGILHPEVARVYHQLAQLYYQLDEKNAAVELARKSVIVFERTLGLDANETILSYLSLAMFEHANVNTKLALVYMKHALELWKIIYGTGHPDSITTLNNAAVMLQHLKKYHESRIWFEHSLAISEQVSGKASVNSATMCFQLAQALALDQDAKAAVNRMREAYSIFLSKLGPTDLNTKESESWLEQLTQNAVSIAKHAKDVQARRLRLIQRTPQITLATRPQRQVGQSSTDVAMGKDARSPLDVDSRSVDELMKFIEGGGDTTKRSAMTAGSRRSNPKRRGITIKP